MHILVFNRSGWPNLFIGQIDWMYNILLNYANSNKNTIYIIYI